MDFVLRQPIAAPLAAVEAAFVDRRFYDALGELPDVTAPEVVEWVDDADRPRVAVRYRFTGDLNAAARAVLDPAKLTWVQESSVDRRSHRTEFRMRPDHYRDRLQCSGVSVLEPCADGTTVQRVEGTVRVRWPLVGGTVERAIVSGLRDHLAAEAAIMERWLRNGRGRERDGG